MFRLRRRKRHSSFLVQRDVGHWQRCFAATRNVSPLQNRTGNAVAKSNGPRWCMSSIETWTHCLVNDKINEHIAIIPDMSWYISYFMIFLDHVDKVWNILKLWNAKNASVWGGGARVGALGPKASNPGSGCSQPLAPEALFKARWWSVGKTAALCCTMLHYAALYTADQGPNGLHMFGPAPSWRGKKWLVDANQIQSLPVGQGFVTSWKFARVHRLVFKLRKKYMKVMETEIDTSICCRNTLFPTLQRYWIKLTGFRVQFPAWRFRWGHKKFQKCHLTRLGLTRDRMQHMKYGTRAKKLRCKCGIFMQSSKLM